MSKIGGYIQDIEQRSFELIGFGYNHEEIYDLISKERGEKSPMMKEAIIQACIKYYDLN